MRTERSPSGGIRAVVFLVFMTAVLLAGCGTAGTGSAEEDRDEKEELLTEEWFYDSFDETKKMAYDAFRRAASDPFGEETVVICDAHGNTAEISAGDLDTVYQGFLYDHPEVFWLSRTYNYRVSADGGEEMADAVSVIPLPESEQELKEQKKEFGSAAEELLQGLDEKQSEKERAGILYDRLAARTQYEEEALYDASLEPEHTAYGALVSGKAVCDGMALAYKYLLGRCGIRCLVIPGESGGAAHVWNTVFWEDAWHEADLTWDTASEGNDRRQYFDLSTEEMNKDHIREAEGIALVIPVSR